MRSTSNPLDTAIDGRGFFAIRLPTGELAYTRAGNFRLGAQGTLMTNDGNPVEPAITIPGEATLIQIAADGTVTAIVDGEGQEVGQLELSVFVNPGGLHNRGSNLFVATAAAGEPTVVAPGEQGAGRIVQGFLESSNVDVVQEFVNMILAQRGYEAISRVLKSADQMYQTANNAVR